MPADVTGTELGRDVVREIVESLGEGAGTEVCRRLVAAAAALEDGDSAAARDHAEVARRRGSRLALVREATGVVAYRTGDYATALRDLTAARRIGGSTSTLAVIADCERALGRPERALDAVATAGEGTELDVADRVELLIVAAGARSDLGQHDAAVATLRTPFLDAASSAPWQARLWFAYGTALRAAGREGEAETWLERAGRHPAAVTLAGGGGVPGDDVAAHEGAEPTAYPPNGTATVGGGHAGGGAVGDIRDLDSGGGP